MKRLVMGIEEYKRLAETAGRLEFFTPLKGSELESVLAHIQLYSCDAGEVIFKKGDVADAFYMIDEGEVTIRLKPKLFGLIRRFARLGPGNMFGEMALLENQPRNATAVAGLGTKLFVFLREDFEALIKRNPTFAAGVRWIAAQRKFQAAH